ncbi:hypothetical protein ACFE04_027125 [Oxalis oulophora]
MENGLRAHVKAGHGCAFIKFETKEQANGAMEVVNGKHKFEGSYIPLVVKWVDTEKERQARRALKEQSQASIMPNMESQHPSIFGAFPMRYVPQHNGYGYQVLTGLYSTTACYQLQIQPGFTAISHDICW